MIFREIRENFSVQDYTFFLQVADKFRIGHAVLAGARVYFYIPEFSIKGFFVSAVGKGVCAGVEKRLMRLAFLFASAVAETFGLFQNAPSALQRVHSLFYSSH